MDAEEEQADFARRPGAGEQEEERWPPASLTLSSRPLPDVVFGAPKSVVPTSGEPVEAPPGAATGPGEVTGPQPVADAAFAVPPPVQAAAPPAGGGAHRRRVALLAAVVLVGVLVVALVAVSVWPSGSEGRARSAGPVPATSRPAESPGNGAEDPGGPERDAPSRQADPVEPVSSADPAVPGDPADPAGAENPAEPGPEAAGAWPVLSGTTSQGIEVTYRTVEAAEGYFEGEVKLVNATGAPLPAWTLSFGYPGASIRNVWGGVFQPREDGTVVVTGDGDGTPVAVGAWVSVRFGGAGTPSRPQGCTVNGAACGL